MPPEPLISLNTFLIQSQAVEHPQLIISLAPPPSPSKRQMGRLFALAEISSSGADAKSKTQVFINKVFKQFQELAVNDAATAFERALDWANHNAAELLDQELKKKLNIIFGCLKQQNIQFAVAGQLTAYIIYKEKNVYQHLDLVKNYTHRAADNNTFFSDLISGVLHPEYFVLFATNSLFDFLTIDRLKKILVSQPPNEVCSYLEKLLNQLENQAGFGGLLIECGHLAPKPAGSESARLTSNASIRKLIIKEQETAQILSPSLWPDIRKLFTFDRPREKMPPPASAGAPTSLAPTGASGGVGATKNVGAPPATPKPRRDLQTLRTITQIYNSINLWRLRIKNGVAAFFLGLGAAARRIYVDLIRALLRIPQTVKNPLPAVKNFLVTFYLMIRPGLMRAKFRFMALTPKRRVLFSIFCILFLFFSISLASKTFFERRQLANEQYNTLVNQIKTKIDDTDAAIISTNEDSARDILQQIQTSLSAFPHNSANRQKMYDTFLAEAARLSNKLQHFTEVTPTVEVDLSTLQTTINPSDFVLTDKNFLFLTRGSGEMAFYNTRNKTLFPLAENRIDNFKNKTLQKNNTILLLNQGNRLVQFNPADRAFEVKEAAWANLDAQIQLISIYNNRLYAVDVKNNRLTKHNPSTTGFGKGESWLKDNKTALGAATDMMIDSTIYLSAGPEIWKLENGQKKNMDLSRLLPPLRSATRLYTQNGSSKLFILDSEFKRIIIWDKQKNKMIAQLTSAQFTDLRDFTVNEKEKKIYILDGRKVLSVKF